MLPTPRVVCHVTETMPAVLVQLMDTKMVALGGWPVGIELLCKVLYRAAAGLYALNYCAKSYTVRRLACRH